MGGGVHEREGVRGQEVRDGEGWGGMGREGEGGGGMGRDGKGGGGRGRRAGKWEGEREVWGREEEEEKEEEKEEEGEQEGNGRGGRDRGGNISNEQGDSDLKQT